MIKIEKFVVNPLGENSYILYDETGECIFVDPGFFYKEELKEIREFVKENSLTPVKIVNTHCHFDHIMGVEFVRNEFQIPFLAHAHDDFWVEKAIEQGKLFGFYMEKVMPIDEFLVENEQLKFGISELEIIHIPGHSPGHVVLYSKNDGILLAGDALFNGSIGRTDLPGGDYETLISNIKSKLFVLPDSTRVFCGHGPETTIGFEKKNNPFLT